MMQLHDAVKAGNLSLVESLLENGSDVNEAVWELPLYMLLIRLILRPLFGPIIKTRPLAIAASKGHTEIASILIKYGAHVNIANSWGLTALHFASRHTETARLLIENGADVNACCKKNRTPLHWAYLENYPETVKLFICTMLLKNPAEKKPSFITQEEYLPFWNEKLEQIGTMKKPVFSTMQFSFYDLMTKDVNLLAKSITTKDLKRLKQIEFIVKYPDFTNFWKKSLNNISSTKKAINENIARLMEDPRFNHEILSSKKQDGQAIKIPELPAKKILSYLHLEDLKSLSKAINPSDSTKQTSRIPFFKSDMNHDNPEENKHVIPSSCKHS